MASTTMQLEGSTCIVTGGGSGIGRAIAKEFAAAGVRVVVGDIDAMAARQVADRICAHGRVAVAGHADTSSTTGIRALIDLAHSRIRAGGHLRRQRRRPRTARSRHRRRRLGSDRRRELECPCPGGGTARARLGPRRAAATSSASPPQQGC